MRYNAWVSEENWAWNDPLEHLVLGPWELPPFVVENPLFSDLPAVGTPPLGKA